MSGPTRIILALMLTVSAAGACASSGATGTAGDGAAPQETAPPEREYAPGTEPSNNMWTRSATLYLSRAEENAQPDERRDLLQQALDASVEGIENDPGNPRPYFLAGQAQVRLGDYVAADSLFDRAQEIYPAYEPEIDIERSNAWVRAYNAGVAALEQGESEDAIAHLERADLIYDKRPEARLNLGAVHAQLGQDEQAIEAYEGALEIIRGPERQYLSAEQEESWQQNEQVATFNLALLLANAGRDREAAEAYRDFLERVPDDLQAQVNLAVVLSRMGETEEASEIYAGLLENPDLDPEDYFQVGIGLFEGEQYELASEAFRNALDANPYNRDALYNLANALYARAQAIETRIIEEGGDLGPSAAGELEPLYQELNEVASRIDEMDPNNRNVLALRAQALRGLSDLESDEAAEAELRSQASAVLERHEALPVEVLNVQVQPGAEESVTIHGEVVNWNLEPGDSVTIDFSLLGPNGAEISSESVTVNAPAVEQRTQFEVEIAAPGEIAGWEYQVST